MASKTGASGTNGTIGTRLERAHAGTEPPSECVVMPAAGEADMKTKAWEITCAMASFGLIGRARQGVGGPVQLRLWGRHLHRA